MAMKFVPVCQRFAGVGGSGIKFHHRIAGHCRVMFEQTCNIPAYPLVVSLSIGACQEYRAFGGRIRFVIFTQKFEKKKKKKKKKNTMIHWFVFCIADCEMTVPTLKTEICGHINPARKPQRYSLWAQTIGKPTS